MKLDLKNNAAAQDMIRIIMREKDLSAEDAVTFAVNRDIYQKILKAGYASILVCNEMSVSSLITAHRGYQTKLKDFKKAISDHCQEMGYI